jgi:hypothetical protein
MKKLEIIRFFSPGKDPYQKILHFVFGDARSDRCGILTTRNEKAIRHGRYNKENLKTILNKL